jgi:hypothetical protein
MAGKWKVNLECWNAIPDVKNLLTSQKYESLFFLGLVSVNGSETGNGQPRKEEVSCLWKIIG